MLTNYYYYFLIRIPSEIKSNIQKFYPAAFEVLTYENYKAKYHTILFMDEIEVSIFTNLLKRVIDTTVYNYVNTIYNQW